MAWRALLILGSLFFSFVASAQNIVELGDGKTLLLKEDGTYENIKIAATDQGEKVILRGNLTYDFVTTKELYLKADGTYEYLAEKVVNPAGASSADDMLQELQLLYCSKRKGTLTAKQRSRLIELTIIILERDQFSGLATMQENKDLCPN